MTTVLSLLALISCLTTGGVSPELGQAVHDSSPGIAERFRTIGLSTAPSTAPSTKIDERGKDQIWLISCRGLSCPERTEEIAVDQLVKGLVFWHYGASESCWNDSDLKTFQAGDRDDMRTVVWVHGNLMPAGEAFWTGLSIYRELIRCASSDQPIRFIIWSWPSAKTCHRPVPDARLKAVRADTAGIRLVGVLATIPPDRKVSLIGFSFGVRVISAALQLLGGGSVDNHRLAAQATEGHHKYRVTLFASAIDSDWLQPQHKFGRAIEEMASLLIINNYCDWVLKHYGKLYCRCARRGPTALGYTGLAIGDGLSDDRGRIRQFNASGYVGRQHAWRPYIYTPQVMALIRQETLGNGVPASAKNQN